MNPTQDMTRDLLDAAATEEPGTRVVDKFQRALPFLFFPFYLLIVANVVGLAIGVALPEGVGASLLHWIDALMRPFDGLARPTVVAHGLLHWSGLFLFGVAFFAQVSLGILLDALRESIVTERHEMSLQERVVRPSDDFFVLKVETLEILSARRIEAAI